MPVSIQDIITEAKKSIPNLNEERVNNAYQFAKEAHKGQKRMSGEPYIIHPLMVTKHLLSLKSDEDTIIASLLHDVLEDTDIKPIVIENKFGPTVLKLTQGVEKISKIQLLGKDREISSLRKMFLAMAEDLRVIFIKLADRLHNMETLGNMPKEKQKRIAEETISIYAPIAGRLGIYHFKIPLENYSFRFLYPKDYKWLSNELEKMAPFRERKMLQLKNKLNQALKNIDIHYEANGRIKHYYSIFKKIQNQNKEKLNEIYDIFALRIIVDNIGDCYALLGEIHKNWTPLSYRFKDYIAVPKPNGYQSLHTTVIGLLGKKHPQPVEIQIRTKEMHYASEYGVASHWSYKENVNKERTKWIQGLVELEHSLQDNLEFEENIKLDTFGDRIFILTPRGEIKDLPKDSTAIDFAYSIHTEIGHHCTGAKINDVIAPLDQPLNNGDVVEIITNKKSTPNQFWLNFVVTSHAKQRIKAWFRSQDTDKLIKVGKELLNKQLIRLGHPELDPHLLLLKNFENKNLTRKTREELLEKIGNGSLSPILVVKKLFPRDQFLMSKQTKSIKNKTLAPKKQAKVIVSGEDIYSTKLAACCKPQENDAIIGYTTRGGYFSIHKQNCKVIQRMKHKERLIKAYWSTDTIKHKIKLILHAFDRVGLIRDITHIFAIHDINIVSFYVDEKVVPDGTMVINFGIEIEDVDKLNHIINRVEGIEGVQDIHRVIESTKKTISCKL